MAVQDPRFTPRQRVAGVPQVDVVSGAAAGQLVVIAHVDTERINESGHVETRGLIPAGFKRAIAAAVQGVVDDLTPFPSKEQ
jgi:hypothetical protein